MNNSIFFQVDDQDLRYRFLNEFDAALNKYAS